MAEEIKVLEETVTILKAENSDTVTVVGELREDIANLSSQLEASQTATRSKEGEIEQLKESLQEYHQSQATLASRLSSLAEENSRLKDKSDQSSLYVRQIAALEADKGKLQAAAKQLSQEVLDINSSSSLREQQLKSALETSQQETSGLQRDLARLKQQLYDDLETARDEAKVQTAQLETKLASVVQAKAKAEVSHSSAISSLEKELSLYRTSKGTMEEEHSRAKETSTALQRRLDDLTSQNATLTASLATQERLLKTQDTVSKEEILRLESRMQEESERSRQTTVSHRSAMAEKTREIDSLKSQVETLKPLGKFFIFIFIFLFFIFYFLFFILI